MKPKLPLPPPLTRLGCLAAAVTCCLGLASAPAQAVTIGGVNLGNLPNYLLFYSDANGDANWQGATKGFVGDVGVNGILADERTSGGVPYAGTIYTNDTTLSAWASIVDQNDNPPVNPAQAFASFSQTSRITGLTSDLNSAFTAINALASNPPPGFAAGDPTTLNGLNTTNGVCTTYVLNVTDTGTVSSKINITGDACDVFVFRWDTDANFADGYEGQVKFQSGGAIVPLGGLKPSNFIHVAGEISSSGGGSNPASPYPQGPRLNNGTGALCTNCDDFNGGGFFTGYWLTTGQPDNAPNGTHSMRYGPQTSLSNGIFVGGWYSINTQFSMTSGTSGVYVSPNDATQNDFGDAPDDPATGTGTSSSPLKYHTRFANNGASHVLGSNVWLGLVKPDGDTGTYQNTDADQDNTTGVSPSDEDGIPTLPAIYTAPPSFNMTVNASNSSGANAFMSCWVDMNKNGFFENANGERGTVAGVSPVTIPTGSSNTPFVLTFTGYPVPTAGNTYIRCRIASASGEVGSSIGAAATGEVEDYRVTITAGGGGDFPYADFGDAPDAGPGNGPGNYTTQDFGTSGNIGANNEVSNNLLLGTAVTDDDNGTLNNSGATADNDTGTNDEDGVTLDQVPIMSATSTSTKLKINATNTIPSGPGVYLACWIDFNRNGVFGDTANELATALVPNGTVNGSFPLSYAHPAMGTGGGNTYMRCRIDSGWTSAPTAADPTFSVNSGLLGEVEDYLIKVLAPCAISAITTEPASGGQLSGIKFTVFPGSPLNGTIKTIACPKLSNIDPVTGMTITPVPTSFAPATAGPPATPATWTYTPATASNVQIVARRTVAGSASLACTVTDTATPTPTECTMDPVITEVFRSKGVPMTVEILDDGKPLSDAFQYVKIINGSDTDPGASQVEINVNGIKFKQATPRKGAYYLNIKSALKPVNKITVTVKGIPGSLLTTMFSDEPIM